MDYNNVQKVVSTERGMAAQNVEDLLDNPKGTERYERVTGTAEGQTWHGIEFYRSLRDGEVSGLSAGDLWVDVYTDYEGDGDTDYLAGGIWVYTPDDATSLRDYEYGAFADGSDPFVQANIMALTSTATYVGSATGVYSVTSRSRNYFVDADVQLNADFSNSSNLGTISGTVSNITGDAPESGWYDGVTINLGSANIGSSNSGFFTGTTTSTGTTVPFSGKWGGQFYGNGNVATSQPGSVAGTFGGATADGDQAFVGVYGAYRGFDASPEPPMPGQ